MAKFNFIQNTFRAGKISPKCFSRTDLQLYYQGCEVLDNLIPRIQGGASRRPGTQFWLESTVLPSVSVKPRLLEYNTSVGGAYILVLSNGNDFIEMFNHFDGTSETVDNYGNFSAFLNNSEIQYVQKDDVMLMAHAQMPPKRFAPNSADPSKFILHDLSETVWNPTGPMSPLTVPYMDANASAITLTPDATTGSWSGTGTGVKLTASADLFTAEMVGASTQQVGTYFRIVHNATVGYFEVAEYISATEVRGSVISALGDTTAVTDWAESAWSRYRGYPRAVCFFEQRVYYGGTKTQPLRLWGSQLGNIYQMHSDEIPANLDELSVLPYSFDLSADKYSFIQWITAKKELTVGTNRAEYTTEGRDNDLALGPDNFKSTEHTNVGSAYIQPIKFDNIFLFLERSKDRIREFTYDLRESGYRTIPLNYLTDPLLEKSIVEYINTGAGNLPSIKQWCSHSTYSAVWAIDSFGKLLSLTRDRTLDIVAFADHPMGAETDDTAIIHSICTIDDGYTEWVVMLVEREVNGTKKLFLERFFDDFKLTDFDNLGFDTFWNRMYAPLYTPEYLDCSYTDHNDTAFSTMEVKIPNSSGATVHVVADGKYLGEKLLTRFDDNDSVFHGLLTLEDDYNTVTVGFNYIPRLVTVPLEAGSELGSAQGRPKRISEVVFKFFKTVGCAFGFKDGVTLQEIPFRDASLPAGSVIEPFTGDKILNADHSYDTEKAQVFVEQRVPLPFYIASITARGQTND